MIYFLGTACYVYSLDQSVIYPVPVSKNNHRLPVSKQNCRLPVSKNNCRLPVCKNNLHLPVNCRLLVSKHHLPVSKNNYCLPVNLHLPVSKNNHSLPVSKNLHLPVSKKLQQEPSTLKSKRKLSLSSNKVSKNVKACVHAEIRNEKAYTLAKFIRQQEMTSKRQRKAEEPCVISECLGVGGSECLHDQELGGSSNLYWLQDRLLFQSDKAILESSSSWLNASIIDASQRVLAQQFKDICGFQSVGCGQPMTFTIIKNASFVQILHDWMTVSNIGCQNPSVNNYDSKFHKCSLHIKLHASWSQNIPTSRLISSM